MVLQTFRDEIHNFTLPSTPECVVPGLNKTEKQVFDKLRGLINSPEEALIYYLNKYIMFFHLLFIRNLEIENRLGGNLKLLVRECQSVRVPGLLLQDSRTPGTLGFNTFRSPRISQGLPRFGLQGLGFRDSWDSQGFRTQALRGFRTPRIPRGFQDSQRFRTQRTDSSQG